MNTFLSGGLNCSLFRPQAAAFSWKARMLIFDLVSKIPLMGTPSICTSTLFRVLLVCVS